MRGRVYSADGLSALAQGDITFGDGQTGDGDAFAVQRLNKPTHLFPWPGPFYIVWDREEDKT